ncbi:MAG: sulfite exporter TauE/SafE family protein [Deltaproteobacteria bacterium]|nr:sulfite exporter TauE/SafE family protein [Candidatus Zymogenaceae bacterium]
MESLVFLSFFVGIAIATVVTITGIGGGVLWMPFLMLVLRLPPDVAVPTALAIQVAGIGSGTVRYLWIKRVDVPLALLCIGTAVPMVVLGSFVSQRLPSHILEVALGLVTIGIALFFISGDDWFTDERRTTVEIREAVRFGIVPLVSSFVSGLLSVGVGDFIVPIMVKRFKLSMEVAVGTAVLVMAVVAVIGVVSHLAFGGRFDTSVLLWSIPGVIIGGQIGPRLAGRIDDRILREIFIFLLLLIGIHILYNAV